MDITRERVRQIESKAKRTFKHLESELKLMPKIFADLNGKEVISLEDLEIFGGEYADALVFLLKGEESGVFTYDSLLEGFVFGDNDLSTRIQDYIDSLPDIIHKKEVGKIIDSVYEEYGIEKEYAEKSFYDSYKITGDVYHRSRLSLSQIYESVLKKYYADGIHVYDDEEIEYFRCHVHDDYGDISLPENNRAISARIADFCILAGRGIYIPKCEPLLSDELATEIYSYITENDSSILFIGNIFSVFEEKLEAEGVNNKYYLQGILHELYGDKLYFKRDYVSKDREFTSIYSSIISFVKASKYPVKKRELNEHFKGITEIMLLAAMNDSEILNYFGQYFHSSKRIEKPEENGEEPTSVPRNVLQNNDNGKLDFMFQAAILSTGTESMSEDERLNLAFGEKTDFKKLDFLTQYANFGVTKLNECIGESILETMDNIKNFLFSTVEGRNLDIDSLPDDILLAE